MSRSSRRLVTALVAVFVLLGAFVLVAAPSASADEQRTPPVAQECPEGFFWATIAGAVSCQPLPSEIVAEPPVQPVPEEPVAEPAPVVESDPVPALVEPVNDSEPVAVPDVDPVGPQPVETAPPAPTFTDECGTANDTWHAPANPGPWLYADYRDAEGGQTDTTGYVQASLPEGFVIAGTDRRDWYPVWEYRFDQTRCPASAPTVPPAPADPVAAPVAQVELATTGTDDLTAPVFLAFGLAALGAAMFAGNHLLKRRDNTPSR